MKTTELKAMTGGAGFAMYVIDGDKVYSVHFNIAALEAEGKRAESFIAAHCHEYSDHENAQENKAWALKRFAEHVENGNLR